jgi:hypothetical protein
MRGCLKDKIEQEEENFVHERVSQGQNEARGGESCP